MVFFEAPHRIAGALADFAEAFGPDRPAALCRELTKTYEEVLRRTLGELADWAAAGDPRGEITLVVAGAPAGPAGPARTTTSCARRWPRRRPRGRPAGTPSPRSPPSTGCAAGRSTNWSTRPRTGRQGLAGDHQHGARLPATARRRPWRSTSRPRCSPAEWSGDWPHRGPPGTPIRQPGPVAQPMPRPQSSTSTRLSSQQVRDPCRPPRTPCRRPPPPSGRRPGNRRPRPGPDAPRQRCPGAELVQPDGAERAPARSPTPCPEQASHLATPRSPCPVASHNGSAP